MKMKANYSLQNVRTSGCVLTTLSSTKSKPSVLQEDTLVINDFQRYVRQKTKQYNHLNQYKSKPRPELIYTLLTQTEADKQFVRKPKNAIIKSTEYNSLCKLYQSGHNEWREGKRGSIVSQDTDFLKSNGIELSLSNEYKKQKRFNKGNTISSSNELITTVHGSGFMSQYDSFKCLHVNKQLERKIYMKQTEEQINQFIFQGLFKEELKLKSSLMPPIRTTLIEGKQTPQPRIQTPPVASSSESPSAKPSVRKETTFRRNNIITIKSMFSQYNLLYVSIKSHFKKTPSSRSQMKASLYMKDSDKKPSMFIYGGVNQNRLNELWKCVITPSKEYERDLVFQWKQVAASGNSLACSGHSMSLYKEQLIVFGGIVNNQKTVNVWEDPLWFSITSKRFASEKCFKHNSMLLWRRSHISEVIGKHMVIYGGIHEEAGILNDAFALDLVKMKWSKAPTNQPLPYLHSMASCLVLYAHHKNTESLSLFKLPQLSELLPPSPLKYEGIFVFGGIDSTGKCGNSIVIMKIGKPLQVIQPLWSGLPPSPRSDCSMNFFEKLNSFIIHGGKDDSIKGGCYFNDFFFYDIIHFQWTRMNTNASVPYRAEHCAVIYDDFLIIFGGIDGNVYQKSDILLVNLNIIENANAEMNPFDLFRSNVKRPRIPLMDMPVKVSSDNREEAKDEKKDKGHVKSKSKTLQTQEDFAHDYFEHFHSLSNNLKLKSLQIKDECKDLRGNRGLHFKE